MEITLNLPENIYKNVSTVAKKSKRKVVDLIVDVVEEKYSSQLSDQLLANRSDAEILALATLQIPEKQSHRHSELLYKNQAGTLTPEEKKSLISFNKFTVLLSRKKRTALPKPFAAS